VGGGKEVTVREEWGRRGEIDRHCLLTRCQRSSHNKNKEKEEVPPPALGSGEKKKCRRTNIPRFQGEKEAFEKGPLTITHPRMGGLREKPIPLRRGKEKGRRRVLYYKGGKKGNALPLLD